MRSGNASQAATIDREMKVIMQVRSTFLELIYWLQAEEVVNKNKQLFRNLVNITQSQYASGVQRQQDVIRANLELDMLDDRLDMIKTKQHETRAKLIKLVGADGANQIVMRLPEFKTIEDLHKLRAKLAEHPLMQVEDAKVTNSQYGIELAKQSYKPNWMFEVGYGFRDGTNPNGTERADFASAMVSFDLPLFTKDKQDRQVAASRLSHQASLDAREERLRQLTSEYDQVTAKWSSLDSRLQRYKKIIVPQARENAKAALHSYQNRRGDFTSLMRARITELETNLKQLRLQVNFRQTQAKLLYLVGETQ